jgi:predicted regulator of Ras-like GTPase activity (Roadblock/LC7/MglB family)
MSATDLEWLLTDFVRRIPGIDRAVLVSADVDLGLVAYEMAVLVKRFGPHMTTPRRLAGQSAGAR